MWGSWMVIGESCVCVYERERERERAGSVHRAENHGDRVCADPVRETKMWGYPMSRWLSGLPEELNRMSYEAREVACHSIDTYREKLSSE